MRFFRSKVFCLYVIWKVAFLSPRGEQLLYVPNTGCATVLTTVIIIVSDDRDNRFYLYPHVFDLVLGDTDDTSIYRDTEISRYWYRAFLDTFWYRDTKSIAILFDTFCRYCTTWQILLIISLHSRLV